MTTITTKWQTICIVGYSGAVSRDENRAAHGGVKMCQARRTRNGELQGRSVNSNGRHEEVGEPFALTEDELRHWESLEAQSR